LNRLRRRHGFSFVEVLVAVAVLALCVIPLANALKVGIAASSIGAAKAQELRCMKNMMETVLAEPFQNLANAARTMDVASSYSLPRDSVCPARNVYIARYEDEFGKDPYFPPANTDPARLDVAMLYITLSSPDTQYAFTTLVAR
jgi:prepilin-type N-terminal cleavage/methylation domain-containing protein